MHPILFQIGDWPVYSYGVLLAAAYLVALQLAVVRARRRGLDGTKVMDLGIYLIIAALVGAKLMLVVVDFDYFRSQPRELLSLVRAGGVFYGGLLAALGVAILLVRRYQLRIWTTADLFAPGIALGHVVGRLGCLMAGCCYGTPTSMPWAITFTNPLAASNVGTPLGIPLHPTQLYDAGAELLILVVLLATERRGKPFEGRTFWLYMLLYGISRFIVEFYRGDERGMIMGVSTSQFVSLLVVPLAIVMLLRLRRRAPL
jgi:phosphatidylglycerol:prolipoprotein diacylglycerol transferase